MSRWHWMTIVMWPSVRRRDTVSNSGDPHHHHHHRHHHHHHHYHHTTRNYGESHQTCLVMSWHLMTSPILTSEGGHLMTYRRSYLLTSPVLTYQTVSSGSIQIKSSGRQTAASPGQTMAPLGVRSIVRTLMMMTWLPTQASLIGISPASVWRMRPLIGHQWSRELDTGLSLVISRETWYPKKQVN